MLPSWLPRWRNVKSGKLLPCMSVKNCVFRIGVVQVAHWDHGPKKTFRSMEQSCCWMATRNLANSPVEGKVVEIYHDLWQCLKHPNGGWEWDFWTINSSVIKLEATLRCDHRRLDATDSLLMAPFFVSIPKNLVMHFFVSIYIAITCHDEGAASDMEFCTNLPILSRSKKADKKGGKKTSNWGFYMDCSGPHACCWNRTRCTSILGDALRKTDSNPFTSI